MTLDALLPLSPKALLKILQEGHPIEPSALRNREYRGVSLGIPAWVERLAWKTFMKTFAWDAERGVLHGWNVRMQQTGLDGEQVFMEKAGAPFTFGHYRVTDAQSSPARLGCRRGLLIDYGQGGNGLDPTSLVRDPIVALEPGNPERLLGWSYVDLGPLSFGTPSFFLLDKPRPLSHHAQPPRPPAWRAA
ncbi:MAG: hypothetical protein H6741_28240 [Alphaproteobacteria bacterium]|nr:hypothetical protein [Alphaproteobacteria bacterium]MCB9796606.1 hypothetical protein [Alphaproteobacteria bacterium]